MNIIKIRSEARAKAEQVKRTAEARASILCDDTTGKAWQVIGALTAALSVAYADHEVTKMFLGAVRNDNPPTDEENQEEISFNV